MRKFLLFFLIFPLFVQAQQIIQTYPGFYRQTLFPYKESELNKVNIHYLVFYSDTLPPKLIDKLNDSIKRYVFESRKFNLSKPTDVLLKKMFKKEKLTLLLFRPLLDQNGLVTLCICIESSKWGKKIPLYLHYDLTTNTFFTLQDMLNSKNDIFSYKQSVYTTMADSIQYFEQTTLNDMLAKGTIDKDKYGKIIEGLNANLSVFRANYLSDFIITDKGIEEDFDCILPDNLLHYIHTYRITFVYKSLKFMVKQEYVSRLMK